MSNFGGLLVTAEPADRAAMEAASLVLVDTGLQLHASRTDIAAALAAVFATPNSEHSVWGFPRKQSRKAARA